MKFYFVKFVYCLDKSVSFYKFGITNHSDALKRFSASLDCRYNEFDIYCLYSVNGVEYDIKRLEAEMLGKYPKNFNLENLTNSDKGHYDNLSGITETVRLSDVEATNILNYLKSIKDGYKLKTNLYK